jgi:hypothetical protein
MIISPDARGQIDGSVQRNLLNHLPDLGIDIVPISYFPDFKFVAPNTNRYVLIDFMESCSLSEELNKWLDWLEKNPPKLAFVREITKHQVSNFVKPIEWAAYLPFPEVQTKEQYDSRPIEVLFVWGYSNVSRPRLHGEIFSEGFAKHGIEVIDNWEDLNRLDQFKGKRVWVSIYAPYWRRKPMAEILPIMEKSKITVSLPGNGSKSFRDTEVVGSLIARHDDGIAFSFPWTEENSIQLIPNMEFYGLEKATHFSDLYERYVKCDANMRKYQSQRYVNEYLVPEVQKVI